MATAKRTTYHHGNLREELIKTTVALLEERGPSGFSLREVARRASVVPAAPAHHFGNVTGLLTAVAVVSFENLLEEFEAISASKGAATERLFRLCEAYIQHFREKPGMASVMFRWDLLNPDAEELETVRRQTRDILRRTVEDALPDDASENQIEGATVAIWTATHGLVALRLDDRHDLSGHIAFYVDAIINGSSRHD
ncbi:MAG: TetR/AcrR family transcriptional regulator [Pseudomonadota bacterium]